MRGQVFYNESPYLKIKAQYVPPKGHTRDTDTFALSVEEAIRTVVDPSILPDEATENSSELFEQFVQSLPRVFHSPIEPGTETVSAILLCPFDYSVGAGSFMVDQYIRWGIPGKQLPVLNVSSLSFHFIAYPKKNLFFTQLVFRVPESQDIPLLQENLPRIGNDLCINIRAVRHARQIVSVKPLTLEQKKILIQENVSSLLERTNKEYDHSIFEQIQDLLFKATAEHKSTQIGRAHV